MYNAGPGAVCCLVHFNSSRFIPDYLAAEMVFTIWDMFLDISVSHFVNFASDSRF